MNIDDQLEDFEVNIDELTDALSPLLNTPLNTTASTLPLLDKAKFYVLLCYSIESLLYSALSASGHDVRKHPIFAELARLKDYFQKIKDAEFGPEKPKTKIDKAAVGRFIKHGLSGNDKFDQERAEQLGKRTHTRFNEGAERKKQKDKVDAGDAMESSSGNEELYGSKTAEEATTSRKDSRSRKSATDMGTEDSDTKMEDHDQDTAQVHDEGGDFTPYVSKSAKKQESKEARRAAKDATRATEKDARRAQRRERKVQRRLEEAQALQDGESNAEQILTTKSEGGKVHSEMFSQLLEGTFEGKNKDRKGKRSKREKGT